MLTWKNSTALQVGRLQIRTNSGAAHTVAYDELAPSHALTTASIPTSRSCSRKEDVNPQPRLVPVYGPRRDEMHG